VPDEIYNLGAQSHVRVSFDMPEFTGDADAIGVTRLPEAIRHTRMNMTFYQASSSEMFGKVFSSLPGPAEVETVVLGDEGCTLG
jgi:GDPmannose 4,6-dehydratase